MHFKTVIVKVYEARDADTVVIGRLSHYGKVLFFCRDYGAGVRTARMCLSSTIPSSIRIAGELVSVSYPGQPKTCRRCGEEGYMAQGCRKPCCFNCECLGHVASDCDLDPLCGICLKPNHPVADCPYLIFSANLEPIGNPVPVPSYVDAARQNRPASPVAASPVDSGRKRKADHESVRYATPEDTPVGDPRGNPERSSAWRGKVRRRERSTREDHQPRVDRGRDTPHCESDDYEDRHQ